MKAKTKKPRKPRVKSGLKIIKIDDKYYIDLVGGIVNLSVAKDLIKWLKDAAYWIEAQEKKE